MDRNLALEPHPAPVERSALVGRLTATEARLTLVTAPAGYGKTTLVAQWAARMAGTRPFAWVTLAEADNKPRTLWRHVAQALLAACPGPGAATVLRELRVISADVTGTVLPLLVNELSARTAPVTLVLDEYDRVSEPACHDQLGFLLDHLPATARVVVVTRAVPPLPLARWRAAGDLAEFGAGELRFTDAEAARLVRTVSGEPASQAELTRLTELTEGWPTGLSLAAGPVRGRQAAARARWFDRPGSAVTDFLTAEVLGRQPAAVRRFLYRTSVLPRFCAPLCAAVTESAAAPAILAGLERDNAFLVPLDETRRWFRFHRQFAQVLRQRLDETEPGTAPLLHRRASEWYRRSGLATAAIDHAVAGGDDAGVVAVIAASWYPRVAAGQAAVVRRWVRALDERVLAADPLAAQCAAWPAALSGDRDTVRRRLPALTVPAPGVSAPAGPLPDGMRSLASSAALLRGYCGFGGPESMCAAATLAAGLEDDPSSPWYAAARTVLGFGRYLAGDHAGATRALLTAGSGEPPLPLLRLLNLSVLSLAAGELGQRERARDCAARALSYMDSATLGETPPAALALAAAGAAAAGQGQLQQALGDLEKAWRLCERAPGGNVWATIDILLRLATVRADLGDRAPAAGLAGQAGRLLAETPGAARAQRARLRQLEQRLAGYTRARALADPLTEHEVVVLQLLPGPLPLRVIAATMGLSVNTIKTQVQSIYAKLGVSARHEAVARGRRAGVL